MSNLELQTKPDGGASVSTAGLDLDWQCAPNKTQWGVGMMEALIPLGKDHHLRLYTDAEAIPMVAHALSARQDSLRFALSAIRNYPGIAEYVGKQIIEIVDAELERPSAELWGDARLHREASHTNAVLGAAVPPAPTFEGGNDEH